MANRLEARVSRQGGLLVKESEDREGAGAPEAGAVVCGDCRYANRVSYAFYVLSVQHMYCRRCGHMIDRNGKPVLPV